MLTVYWEECFLLGYLEGFGFSVCFARNFVCAVLSRRYFLLPTLLLTACSKLSEKLVLFFSKQADAFFVVPLPPFFSSEFSVLHLSDMNFYLFDSRGKDSTCFPVKIGMVVLNRKYYIYNI